MTNPKHTRPRLAWMAAAVAAATLTAACGGGGGGGTGAPAPVAGPSPAPAPAPSPSPGPAPAPTPTPAPPPSTAVPVRVVDGPIQNAVVCLDTNANGQCDAGEPTARTAADGRATLQVLDSDLAKYPVVAVIGTDAVDADSGPVTVPYTMKAPADQPALVTPLTTLVQQVVETNGGNTASAASLVQSALKLSVSPLQDFTTASTAANREAALAAQLVVRATQQIQTAATSLVGQSPAGGTGVVTAADARAAVSSTVTTLLADVAAAVQTAVTTCGGSFGDAACQTAIRTTAETLVANAGVSAQTLAAGIGAAQQQARSTVTEATTVPGGNLTFFSVAPGGQSWSWRVLRQGTADLVPDAQGLVGYREIRQATNATGGVDTWGAGLTFARKTDLHWNGRTWFDCPENFQSKQTRRDSAGRTSYDYCDGLERGISQRTVVDIGGRTLLSVVEQIRSLPYRAGSPWGASYADWGVQPGNGATLASLFPAGAVFPTGSRLLFQTNTATETAIAFDPSANNRVVTWTAAVAAGGDARTGSPACGSIAPGQQPSDLVTTLEMLVSRGPGVPCRFGPTTQAGPNGSTIASGPTNDWWSNSTFSLGTVGTAPVTGGNATTYYTTNRLLRVSFGSGSTANYWSCTQRAFDGSTRNCEPAGSGTYTITTLGDARVMTFTNLPTASAPGAPAGLSFDRVFVERGGAVYFGFKSKPVVNAQSVRLDLVAANAMFARVNEIYAGTPGWRPLPTNLTAETPAVP